jgi:hypothetical protein
MGADWRGVEYIIGVDWRSVEYVIGVNWRSMEYVINVDWRGVKYFIGVDFFVVDEAKLFSNKAKLFFPADVVNYIFWRRRSRLFPRFTFFHQRLHFGEQAHLHMRAKMSEDIRIDAH